MVGQLGIGRVLATSVRVWLRHLPRLSAITAVLYLPVVGWNLGRWIDWLEPMYVDYDGFFELHVLLGFIPRGDFVMNALTAAALTHAVLVALSGRPAVIGGALRTAAQRFLPVIPVALAVQVLTLGSVVAVLWNVTSRLESDVARALPVPFLISAGYLALRSLFYVAIPCATAERRGVVGSIVRSFQLARGARLRVLALTVVASLFVRGCFWLLKLAVVNDAPHIRAFADVWKLYGYLSLGLSVVVQPLAAVIAAVTYRALRDRKEGPGSDELTRVFE